jgi:hypothetical protein
MTSETPEVLKLLKDPWTIGMNGVLICIAEVIRGAGRHCRRPSDALGRRSMVGANG